MERTDTTIGKPLIYNYVEWPDGPSHLTLRHDYQLTSRFDTRSDGISVPHYPNFITSHVYFDGTRPGMDFQRPETEFGAPIKASNWIPGCFSGSLDPVSFPHLYQEGIPRLLDQYSAGALATSLLAKTNPSRPEVSLPAMIAEGLHDVKDIPSKIYNKGREGIEKSSPDSLGIQFGILPFVSDVYKLTRLSEAVDKRVVELDNLRHKDGALVHRTLRKLKTVMEDENFNSSRDSLTSGRIRTVTESRIWGTARWIPSGGSDSFARGGKPNRKQIRSLLLGIANTKDIIGYARDAWEAVPWSWFADWYGNFGEYLEANQNAGIATPSSPFIMMERKTTRTYKCPEGSCTVITVTKQRRQQSASLSVGFPLLSENQMSILYGLARRAGPSQR